jgi:TolA-binding protein
MTSKLMKIALFLCLAGCLKTRAELAEEQSGHAQQVQTIAQQNTNVKESVRERAPPSAYRFEEYDEQLRQLTGRVDTLENSMQQTAKQKDLDGAIKDKQAVDQKFVAFEEALNKLQTQLNSLSEELAKLKAPPPEPPPAPTAAASTKAGRSTYDQGEELFTSKKWKEAILNYQKYRDAYPKGKMFADASYKIGVCFQELGMKDEARAFLDEVISKFPGSKEAKKASFRLKSLK